jgi:hypothetical protein
MMRKLSLALGVLLVPVLSGCAGFASGADPANPVPLEKQARESHYAADKAAGEAAEAAQGQHIQPGDLGPPSDDPKDTTGISGFITKVAGDGQIVETGNAGPPGTSDYVWQNEGVVTMDGGGVISVYAGARKADPKRGVLLVTTWDQGQGHLLKSFTLTTPALDGSVRFIAGVGKTATLLAADGSTFTFDADSLSVK